jgi:hypothetical protein
MQIRYGLAAPASASAHNLQVQCELMLLCPSGRALPARVRMSDHIFLSA